jgi:hypothetical protein
MTGVSIVSATAVVGSVSPMRVMLVGRGSACFLAAGVLVCRRFHHTTVMPGISCVRVAAMIVRHMLPRIHILPDHIGGFGLEVGIVRLHVALEPMRLQPCPLPRVRHIS